MDQRSDAPEKLRKHPTGKANAHQTVPPGLLRWGYESRDEKQDKGEDEKDHIQHNYLSGQCQVPGTLVASLCVTLVFQS